MDPFESFKAAQKEGWAKFAPFEVRTIPCAAQLVKRAGVRAGQRVLDIACGTGVVAVTAARLGARVTGVDLTPELLDHARENARIAQVEIDWLEGDVENLPFGDAAFDVVLSQFGHMMAPRPEIAIGQMVRVLRPGGTIAFSTWPPELFSGRTFDLMASYVPPPPGVPPPPQWGDPAVVRQRLGSAVKDIRFDRAVMLVSALSPQHYRATAEKLSAPMIKVVATLEARGEPHKLEEFRRAYDTVVSEYSEDNMLRQDYLITSATKI
jgi:SAM-dependent methyltransferase